MFVVWVERFYFIFFVERRLCHWTRELNIFIEILIEIFLERSSMNIFKRVTSDFVVTNWLITFRVNSKKTFSNLIKCAGSLKSIFEPFMKMTSNKNFVKKFKLSCNRSSHCNQNYDTKPVFTTSSLQYLINAGHLIISIENTQCQHYHHHNGKFQSNNKNVLRHRYHHHHRTKIKSDSETTNKDICLAVTIVK